MEAHSLWGRAARGQPTVVVGTPFAEVPPGTAAVVVRVAADGGHELARGRRELSRGVEQVLRSLEQAEERLGRIHLPGER